MSFLYKLVKTIYSEELLNINLISVFSDCFNKYIYFLIQI